MQKERGDLAAALQSFDGAIAALADRGNRTINGLHFLRADTLARLERIEEAENAFLESHSWDDYSAWFLGLTEGATDGTKARYAFVYGDFRRVHRDGLIACVYRAAEWRHKDVELAAHELLQLLDRTSG